MPTICSPYAHYTALVRDCHTDPALWLDVAGVCAAAGREPLDVLVPALGHASLNDVGHLLLALVGRASAAEARLARVRDVVAACAIGHVLAQEAVDAIVAHVGCHPPLRPLTNDRELETLGLKPADLSIGSTESIESITNLRRSHEPL